MSMITIKQEQCYIPFHTVKLILRSHHLNPVFNLECTTLTCLAINTLVAHCISRLVKWTFFSPLSSVFIFLLLQFEFNCTVNCKILLLMLKLRMEYLIGLRHFELRIDLFSEILTIDSPSFGQTQNRIRARSTHE